jgi:prepilin-type N-terminal cleavage/methylation domain-containing protein
VGALKHGFTLIELVVVVAVLGLLALLAAPPAASAIERGRVGRVVADLRMVEVALEAYRTDHGQYPPVTVSCMAADAARCCSCRRNWPTGGICPSDRVRARRPCWRIRSSPGQTYKYAAPENGIG